MSRAKRTITTGFLSAACILFTLGMLGRISFGREVINVYLYEPIWFVWIALCFFSTRHSKHLNPRVWYALIFFILSMGLSSLVHTLSYTFQQQLVATLYSVRLLAYLLGVCCAATASPSTTARRGLWFIILAAIVGSLVQFALLPDLRVLKSAGWDPHRFRMVGVFLDSAVSAAVYGLLFLTIVQTSLKGKWLLGAVLLGLFLLTYSRGAYVALFFSVLPIITTRKMAFYMGVALCAVFAFFFILPKPQGEGGKLLRTSTIASRLSDYEEGFLVWKKAPIVGIGYNHIRDVKSTGYTLRPEVSGVDHAGASFHSSFLIISATLGVIGLSTYIGFLWSLWQTQLAIRSHLVFVAVYSLFDNILLHPHILFLLSVILLASYTHAPTKLNKSSAQPPIVF
jgi:hypothetical protein